MPVVLALLLAAATPELPPSPPRVTATPLPGGAVFSLAYDQRRADLPSARLEEIRASVAEVERADLRAGYLRLRAAHQAAELAATKAADEAKSVQREKDRLGRQQAEIDDLEKQAETAKANYDRWRNRDEKQAAQYQSTYQTLNTRLGNERKQLARTKANQGRSAEALAEAEKAAAVAATTRETAAAAYAKTLDAAGPALKKLRTAAGITEPR